MSKLEIIQKEISTELAKPEIQKALVETTFKGLTIQSMQKAILEGMIRGFEFKDFLEKNVYAIPYGSGYSLVTSVDYARKVGMRSNVVGVSEPIYETDGKNIISCMVTVKRKVNEYVGEYTAKVYFDEYTTGRNLWVSKPRTMIAKVAEMHALRKACPEELSQSYVEEELVKEIVKEEVVIDVESYKTKLENTTTLDEMKKVWSSIPIKAKQELETLKDELKAKYENNTVSK